jgi:hypothetical protein
MIFGRTLRTILLCKREVIFDAPIIVVANKMSRDPFDVRESDALRSTRPSARTASNFVEDVGIAELVEYEITYEAIFTGPGISVSRESKVDCTAGRDCECGGLVVGDELIAPVLGNAMTVVIRGGLNRSIRLSPISEAIARIESVPGALILAGQDTAL